MTSRERVLKALNFEEPDRVPIDLRGTIMSGIMAHPLDRLRKYLGCENRPVKVYEVFQMLGEVEADVVERLGVDVLPVEPPVQFFGLRREGYKPWKLWDGTEVRMPGQFNVEVDTQRTLPFGRAEEVIAEVTERIQVFAPGGGFVFNPVHNVQQGTPPEHIVAAFDTAREAGRYPICGG